EFVRFHETNHHRSHLAAAESVCDDAFDLFSPAYQPYLKFGSPPFFLAMASVKMRKARDLALMVIAFGDFLCIVMIVVALARVALKPERKHVVMMSCSWFPSRRRIVGSVEEEASSERGSRISPLSSSISTCPAITKDWRRSNRSQDVVLSNGTTHRFTNSDGPKWEATCITEPHLSDCYKPTLFTTEPPLFSTKTGSTTYRSTMASPNPLNSPPPRYGLRLTLPLTFNDLHCSLQAREFVRFHETNHHRSHLAAAESVCDDAFDLFSPAYQPYLKFGSPPFFLAMASVKMRKARDLALMVIAFGDFLCIVMIVVALARVALKPERKHVVMMSCSWFPSRRRIVGSVEEEASSERGSRISPLSSSISTCPAITK
ncbi:LOW QUALITY PROTEIN: hypothetical protein HID58_007124, partial [Brassica napus]